jgi:hypothetical protein
MAEVFNESIGKRFIYQLIYTPVMQKNLYARSPTLDTVIMVEKSIERYSGEFNRTELWKKLPKKVMWQTYVIILDYLQDINKVAIDQKGKIGYIWNPALAKMLRDRKEIRL